MLITGGIDRALRATASKIAALAASNDTQIGPGRRSARHSRPGPHKSRIARFMAAYEPAKAGPRPGHTYRCARRLAAKIAARAE